MYDNYNHSRKVPYNHAIDAAFDAIISFNYSPSDRSAYTRWANRLESLAQQGANVLETR